MRHLVLHELRMDERRKSLAECMLEGKYARPGPKSGGVPQARHRVYLEGTLA